MIYNLSCYNDMGHLMLSPYNIPSEISKFIYSKFNLYLNYATDNSNLGCRFYILKPGLSKKWTYYYGPHTINLTYDLDTFNPNKMKMLVNNIG